MFKRAVACIAAVAFATGLALADEVELKSGEKLVGKITADDGQTVFLEHPILGNVPIKKADIKSLKKDPPPADLVEPEPPKVGPEQPDWLDGWTMRLEAGLNGSSGNTVENSMYVAFKAKRETEEERTVFETNYFRKKTGGTTTEDKGKGELTQDWLVPGEPWFWFVLGRVDWDRFQPYDYRITANTGLGYAVVKSKPLDWNFRVGLGGSKDEGENIDTEVRPEALLGTDLVWRITKKQRLEAKAYLYPELQKGGDYRATSQLDWIVSMDPDTGLSLKVGVQNEYNSSVTNNARRNDTKYYAALVFEF